MYDGNIIGRIFLGSLRQWSSLFGKSSENFGKYLKTFILHSLLTFWEAVEIFRKYPEILEKSSLVCLYNEQKNTWLLVNMEFLFKCSTSYLAHSLHPLMR